jgi:putative acetyltransferase
MALAIQPISSGQIEAAKAVITEGCFEFFGEAPVAFEDMSDVSRHYNAPCGTFLVLMDERRVVGTGAIRRLDEQTCELKRMWFLPAYRGKGHGTRMFEMLLEFARLAGYRRMRLDTVPVLNAANKLYRRLGFYPIEHYNDGPGIIFLEKQL